MIHRKNKNGNLKAEFSPFDLTNLLITSWASEVGITRLSR